MNKKMMVKALKKVSAPTKKSVLRKKSDEDLSKWATKRKAQKKTAIPLEPDK